MEIKLYSPKENQKKPSEASIFFVFKNLSEKQLKAFPKTAVKASQEKLFSGEKDEVLFMPYAQSHTHYILVGLGDKSSFSHQDLRHGAGHAYKVLNQKRLKTASVDLSLIPQAHSDEMLRALCEGFLLSKYKFDDLKKSKEKKESVSQIRFLKNSASSSKKQQKTDPLKEALILSDAVNFARRLGDTPGNLMTPAILAEEVRKKTKNTSLKVTVWNKEKIKKEKMGGLLGVSLGSHQEPRFIIMEYQGVKKSSAKPVCFVGKGLTFDSGGISIKPAPYMDEMKYDMCGGAAVIGAMLAISSLKLKVNALAFVPASENMPGAAANKPGDILRARNGKTMEVLNTDAEGRLILADALSYASEKKPLAIFDAATLTGAMVVALGNSHTGFFTKSETLSQKIEKASQKSGESVWRLPLTEDHTNDIKSPFADVANIQCTKGAGSATAAAFLEHFVDKQIPWAHFDIAGTAWNVSRRQSYCQTKGASGVMVRTFYELAKSYV